MTLEDALAHQTLGDAHQSRYATGSDQNRWWWTWTYRGMKGKVYHQLWPG